MHSIITRILRIIMGVLLLFVLAVTTLQFPAENWWVFIVLALLVGNVEVTAFKELKHDTKAVSIFKYFISYIIYHLCYFNFYHVLN